MSERLRHLQRQQNLLREHLAWIEAEIARETAAPPVRPETNRPSPIQSPAPPPAQTAPLLPTAADTPTPAIPPEADALIERYAADERQKSEDLRRGCLWIFGILLLLLVGGVGAIWLLYY